MIRVRRYDGRGPTVVLLHGGPGASGYLAPVARRLSGSFRVLEPLQRGSGETPLGVARHVADLHEAIESYCPEERPALVGHSWGAMLALAYGAEHPGRAAALALVGCGTFDDASRDRLRRALDERMEAGLKRRIAALARECPDPDDRLELTARLLLPVYSCDAAGGELEVARCDARAGRESWDDMLRLQEAGVYPGAFSRIEIPVLMLHGAVDPHPGGAIRSCLANRMPQLEYLEWERCGHYPWLERAVGDEFHAVLGEWLARRLAP